MIRAEGVICGTSTTGTGTLTLAACPSPPGGVDPYAAFNGQGLGTSQSSPMPYVIIEYTDNTFATAKQQEKGIGFLLIGASVTATTLARTTVQSTGTGLNTSTPTYSSGAPSAISIGTAANTLIFVGASAADISAWSPYVATDGDNLGAMPVMAGYTGDTSQTISSSFDYYTLFDWRVPMLVKRMSIRVASSSATSSQAYGRIYAVGSNGRPGKLLIDFGSFGTNPLNSAGNISAIASAGVVLLPSEYFANFALSASGGSAALVNTGNFSMAISGRMGCSGLSPIGSAYATSPTFGTAPDPADTSGYSVGGGSQYTVAFALKSS